MCTALTLSGKDHYFGRNLDLEYSYKEEVVITPRNFLLAFRHQKTLCTHYALIGMAYVCDGYPLYYDATNEEGLSMAGLNFPADACYYPYDETKDNITPFELIPWILGQCKSVGEARIFLEKINLLDEAFREDLPLSPLHWMLSDCKESVVIESTKEGLVVAENPVGVLTNSPSFEMQMFHLNNYINLSNEIPVNHFAKKLPLKVYSNGMGALGMPGDWSSQSRFVKAAFLRMNAVCDASENDSISQFFHILDAVAHPRGCVAMKQQKNRTTYNSMTSAYVNEMSEDSAVKEDTNLLYEITLYSSCCNTTKDIYYYKTYHNNQITAVSLQKENLDGTELISYSLRDSQQIFSQN